MLLPPLNKAIAQTIPNRQEVLKNLTSVQKKEITTKFATALGVAIPDKWSDYVAEGIYYRQPHHLETIIYELKKELIDIPSDDKWIYATLVAGFFRESDENPFLDEEEDSWDYDFEAEESFNKILIILNNNINERVASNQERIANNQERIANNNEAIASNNEAIARAEENIARLQENTARTQAETARLHQELEQARMRFYTEVYLRNPSTTNKNTFVELVQNGLNNT